MSRTFSNPIVAHMLFDFEGDKEGQLPLQAGEEVLLLGVSNGWYLGASTSNLKRRYAPGHALASAKAREAEQAKKNRRKRTRIAKTEETSTGCQAKTDGLGGSAPQRRRPGSSPLAAAAL
eukprot:scaffold8184_cov258-Pinguiococcus_pyrenoidosus.AAC.7